MSLMISLPLAQPNRVVRLAVDDAVRNERTRVAEAARAALRASSDEVQVMRRRPAPHRRAEVSRSPLDRGAVDA